MKVNLKYCFLAHNSLRRYLLGTNFYFFSKDKDAVKKYIGSDYELTDEPELGYEIHIGKRSGGWLPLFQYRETMSSVEKIKDVYNTGKFAIYDEYWDKEYTWNEFEDALINWNGGYLRKNNCWMNNEGELLEREKVLQMNMYYPASHFDAEINKAGFYNNNCIIDKDGYEFMIGDFS